MNYGFRCGILTEWAWLREGGTVGIVEGAVAASNEPSYRAVNRRLARGVSKSL